MGGGHGHGHVPTREELTKLIVNKPIPGTYKTIALVLAALGFGLFIFGAATGENRAWQAYQMNWMYFSILAAAGVTFSAVQRIVTARWSRSAIRFMEGHVAFLPFSFVLLLVMLFFGLDHVFPWATTPPTVHEKALYLAKGFLIPRDIVAFGLITLFGVWFVYNSVKMDVAILPEDGASWAAGLRAKMRAAWSGDERRELHTQHSVQGKIAVAVIICFGIFMPVLAWDLSMSADVHFQSTMYGWQVFFGGWLNNMMLFALLVRWWKQHLGASTDVIGDNVLHDVGKLCFAFTAFWGYITFSQFLVIWFGNWYEETHFFNLRLSGVWKNMTFSIAALTFAAPFLGLMGKAPKMFTPTMALFASFSFIGIWMQRYIEIYPSIYGEIDHLPFGFWEIGIGLGFLGLHAWAYMQFMDAFPKMRVFMMTSKFRDEVQVPVNAKTMEPLPAHE
jgi:hypothetical protein